MAKARLRNADGSQHRNTERIRIAAAGQTEATQPGTVLKTTGSWYTVILNSGEVLACKVRGKLRLKGMKTTNPIAVGDRVGIVQHDSGTAMIATRDERRNYIIRKATNLSRQEHVIATNMDLAAMVVTLVAPRVSYGFMDRFLVTAEAYDIPAVLLLNKMDLYPELRGAMQWVEELEAIYTPLGYPVLRCSATTGEGLAEVQDLLQGRTTLFTGHSGVGKSTVANAIAPDLDLRTGDISAYSMKGKHTTTFAEMHPLPFGGYLIDTPGIKELGLVDLERHEIAKYYPEMRSLASGCRFYNCLHIQEPGCAVMPAVEAGAIAPSRYNSYLSILANEDQFN